VGQCPAAGDQVARGGGGQGWLACLAGSRGGVAGLDQQARELVSPVLRGGLEVVQSLQPAGSPTAAATGPAAARRAS
jgi:hypothetical protein